MIKTLSRLFTLIVTFTVLGLASVSSASALSYNNGTYTNLCGSGTAATAASCNGGCNTTSGSCSSSINGVVKYVCDGRVTDCRQNESSFSTYQNLSGVTCGKTVQLDVFSKNCRENGNWVCTGGELRDYMVWYSGDCPANNQPSGNSCNDQQHVNTQFRSGTTHWVSGTDITNQKLVTNSRVDINCFAKTGTAQLPGAVIDVTLPNGSTQRLANGPESNSYQLTQNGNYTFRCTSTTIANCGDADTFTVYPVTTQAPPANNPAAPASCNRTCGSNQACATGLTCYQGVCRNPTCNRDSDCNCNNTAPTPAPAAPRASDHRSACDDLTVVGGDNSLVPAKVTLRARGSDNKGNIQRYKFFFGDGKQEESDNPEIQHTYESSGRFIARVDVKDSQGNWKTSNSCEDNVTVKAAAVESHKSGCSDLFITANNGGMAPATLNFKVTGYDNKGDLQHYKLEFGNGVTREGDGQTFEQRYETAGTFTARAYVRDSQGNWKGGEENCKKTVYITTKPLERQPSTGTPDVFTVSGIMSGVTGLAMALKQRRLFWHLS